MGATLPSLMKARLKARLRGWLFVAAMVAVLTLAMTLLHVFAPVVAAPVTSVLGSPWLVLVCFVLACEADYWVGHLHGYRDYETLVCDYEAQAATEEGDDARA